MELVSGTGPVIEALHPKGLTECEPLPHLMMEVNPVSRMLYFKYTQDSG
jgi:hypothetical protein